MWPRSWRAWRARWASRWSGSSLEVASRKASSGTFASTTTLRPPASRTTRSGRWLPSASWTCSSKSQRSTRPASSTARRRWSSPHRPRTCGRRSAVERLCVSRRSPSAVWRMSSTCWWSWPCQVARACSKSCSWSLSRSRPCMTSAWSTMPCPSPSTYDGRERAQSTPTSAPTASPTRSIISSDITFIRPRSQGPPTTLVTVCPMRHRVRAGVVAVGACLLLSGCFGSSSPEPTAAHTRSHRPSETGSPSEASVEHADQPRHVGSDDRPDVRVDLRHLGAQLHPEVRRPALPHLLRDHRQRPGRLRLLPGDGQGVVPGHPRQRVGDLRRRRPGGGVVGGAGGVDGRHGRRRGLAGSGDPHPGQQHPVEQAGPGRGGDAGPGDRLVQRLPAPARLPRRPARSTPTASS